MVGLGFKRVMRSSVLFGGLFALLLVVGGGAFVLLAREEPVAPAAVALPKEAAAPMAARAPEKESGELSRLKQENALLQEQLDNLRAELSRQEAEAALAREAAAKAETPEPTNEDADTKEFWGDVKEAVDDEGERRGRRERRERGAGDPERAQIFREQVDQYYDEQLAAGGPPEVMERLQALQEYSHQMMDLREQMRGVEDPAARDAMRAQLEGLREEMKPLVKDQQEYMLRAAAERAGVTDARTQNRVADAMRDTLRDPMFTMNNRGPGGGGNPPGGGKVGPGGKGGGGK